MGLSIIKSTKRVTNQCFPYVLEFGEWDSLISESPKRTAQAFNYILLKGSNIRGLRPLTAKQFFKMKDATLREDSFPTSLLPEAESLVVQYREKIHRSMKEVNFQRTLLRKAPKTQ